MKVYTARLSEQGANRVYLKIDVEARDAKLRSLEEIVRKAGLLTNMLNSENSVVATLTSSHTTSLCGKHLVMLSFDCGLEGQRLQTSKKYLIIEVTEK